jgi:hypothetical protein
MFINNQLNIRGKKEGEDKRRREKHRETESGQKEGRSGNREGG